MIPFQEAIDARTHKRVVLVVSAQSGKTESVFDVIGRRLDLMPVPMIYVGPSKDMLEQQLEPRITSLLEDTPLRKLMASKKKQRLRRKWVNGVPLRLAHGGSSAALKSDPAGLIVTDEADEMMSNVRGAGSPIELADMRGDTYADFVHAVISTPSEGVAEAELDEDSGLEFWSDSDPEEVGSTIWRLWLSGTRYHWAWPCPHCGEYFIPRFACLGWDKEKSPDGRELPSDPNLARRTAHLVCPRNGCLIYEQEIAEESNRSVKEWMNENGVYVAPGQRILRNGTVVGDPPDSWTISFWVSGLASPFVSWGERAARYVNAVRSKDPETIKAVKNGGFGELFSPGGGQAPELSEVRACSDDYAMGTVPPEVKVLTLTADVQKDRVYYVIRGWGAYGSSWLVKAEELFGDTSRREIWDALATVVTDTYGGLPIRLALVDSGFRPGKPFVVPEHRVYEFARRFTGLVYATKGSSTQMRKPIVRSVIDITLDGKEYKNGLELLRLDTDAMKSWVQQRIRWDKDAPGAWFLPEDISDDYCRQVISEARIMAPGGRPKWVQKSKDNHYLDCEAMQSAAQNLLNVHTLRPDSVVRRRAAVQSTEPDTPPAARPKPRRSGWLDNESVW